MPSKIVRVTPSSDRPTTPWLLKPGSSQIEPLKSHAAVDSAVSRSITRPQQAGAIFNWGMWGFLMFLMLSQLLTAINNTTQSSAGMLFGQDPSNGLIQIPGLNDEPYSDRAVVCVRYGKRYKAVTVNDALASGSIMIEDSTGTAVHGYRVVNRSGHFLTEKSKQRWTQTCQLIDSTLSYMLTVCETFGYTNLTRDNIRIVDGVSSKTVKRIPNSLPILIVPFFDNSLTARYAIPGWNGHACILRLAGTYEDPSNAQKYIFGIEKTLRENPIVEWLGRPGGVWKHGWYEDLSGTKWNGDVVYIDSPSSDNMRNRQFDPIAKRELSCRKGSGCFVRKVVSQWSEFRSIATATNVISVAVSNGARYGLFYYRATLFTTVECIYDFSAFLSNASVIALLFRWMMSMIALQRGYRKGLSAWQNASIGAVANSYNFTVLPIVMLPRLKMILAAFFTVGCSFEGPQTALADAWFVMYPSIVDFVLIYASLLNSFAKILRRRMSDSTVTPTIMILSVMHYYRNSIARSSLFGFGGRLSTIVQPNEFDKLTILDIFIPRNAVHMNGNASSLLIVKLAVLAINILPLIFSENMSLQNKRSRSNKQCKVEKALTIRACNIGGFGQSSLYDRFQDFTPVLAAMNAYELTRLEYVVIGDRYLITWENWMILTTVGQMRSFYSLWNHRIMAFKVTSKNKESQASVSQVNTHGKLLPLNDPELNNIVWWDVDARPLV